MIDDTYSFEINVTDRSGNKTKSTVTGGRTIVACGDDDATPIPNPFSPATTPGQDDATTLRYTTAGAATSRVEIYSKASGTLVRAFYDG